MTGEGVTVDASDQELQQYLFDLQGLFSEAVMHGTAPWRADHERRTLLYKYCVSQMAWSRARVFPPPDVPLTPRQQALLTEPADPHTFVPSLFSDGPGAER